MKCIKIMSAAFLFLSICSCNKNTVEKIEPINEPVIEPVRTEKTTQTVETTNNNETSPKTKAALPTTNVALHKVMTVTENLNLRQSEDKDSTVLTVMAAGSKVKILYLGKGEIIDGIYSNWVKVEVQPGSKDRDGKYIQTATVGWCYGGYTENPEDPDIVKKERISTNPNSSTYDDIMDKKIDSYFDGNLYFCDLNINDSIDAAKQKLKQHRCEFDEKEVIHADAFKIRNKGWINATRMYKDFCINFYKGKISSLKKWNISLEEAQNICYFFDRDFDVADLMVNQNYIIKKANWTIKIGNSGNMSTLEIYNNADIIEKNNLEFDGNLYFFDLTINDSIDTVKEKLRQHGCEFEDETDNDIEISRIRNKGLDFEEWTTQDYIILFYEGKIYRFIKWNVSLEEAQNICDYDNSDFDVSKLKLAQCYTIKKGNWDIKIENNGYINILYICNHEIEDSIQY